MSMLAILNCQTTAEVLSPMTRMQGKSFSTQSMHSSHTFTAMTLHSSKLLTLALPWTGWTDSILLLKVWPYRLNPPIPWGRQTSDQQILLVAYLVTTRFNKIPWSALVRMSSSTMTSPPITNLRFLCIWGYWCHWFWLFTKWRKIFRKNDDWFSHLISWSKLLFQYWVYQWLDHLAKFFAPVDEQLLVLQ